MIRYTYTQLPIEPHRLAVKHWMVEHGIDPKDVAVPGWLEIRKTRRQIVWLAYQWTSDERGPCVETDDVGNVLYVERVLQLDATPAAFPLDPNALR